MQMLFVTVDICRFCVMTIFKLEKKENDGSNVHMCVSILEEVKRRSKGGDLYLFVHLIFHYVITVTSSEYFSQCSVC